MIQTALINRMAWTTRLCGSLGVNLRRRLSASVSVCLALLATGCASPALKVENVKHVQRIAIAGPENPASYQLYDVEFGTAILMGLAVHPGATAGTGSLPDESTRQDELFTQGLVGRGLSLGDEVNAAIKRTFTVLGYEVIPARVTRRNPHRLINDVEGLDIDADALLDVAIQEASYHGYTFSDGFGPSLKLKVRLVDLPSGKSLFKRDYFYDLVLVGDGNRVLRPPETLRILKSEYLLTHPEIPAEAFRLAIRMIMSDLYSEFAKAKSPSGGGQNTIGELPALCTAQKTLSGNILKICEATP